MYRASNLKSIKTLDKELETLKEENDVVDGKLACLLKSSKDLENLIESQRSDKVKEGVGYNDVPPPIVDLYLSLKKDLSWTGLPEFADDTVTNYSRPSPTVESTSAEAERPTTDKVETAKKPVVRYVEMYRRTSKRSSSHRPHGGSMRPSPRPALHRVDRFPTDDLKFSSAARRAPRSKMNSARPNKPAHSYGRRLFQETTQDLMIILIQRVQRLEKELKSRTHIHKKKACYNCGDFNHLAYDCRKRVKRGTSGSQNGAPVRPSHRPADHRPHGAPMRPPNRPVGHRPHGPPMRHMRSNMNESPRAEERVERQLRVKIGRCSEVKKKPRNKKLEDSEAKHQV
nr:hypothetical protein [Tanacetum cinerariifolium]